MVAAKLDQSRVLVTKFRQNRLTLKGRSACQRHTDWQTNSAENNGRQVCNRANRHTANTRARNKRSRVNGVVLWKALTACNEMQVLTKSLSEVANVGRALTQYFHITCPLPFCLIYYFDLL